MVALQDRRDYLLAGALAALTLALTLYFAPRGFNAGFVDLAHDGLQLRQVLDLAMGGMVFRDTFDQYGVLAPYLNLIGFLTLGERLMAIKWFVAGWYAVTTIAMYGLSRQFVGPLLAAFSILLWLALAPFYQHGIMLSPHAYALLFQAIALIIVLRDPAGERPSGWWLVGVLAGVCALLKQSLGALFLVAIVLFLLSTVTREPRVVRAVALRVGRVLAGFAVVVALALGWLAASGALRDWYLQTVMFPNTFYLSYYRDAGSDGLAGQIRLFANLQASAEGVWLDLRTVVIAAGLAAMFSRVGSRRLAWVATMVGLGLFVTPFWGVAHARGLVLAAAVAATMWRAPADPKLVLALWVTGCLWLAAFPSGNHMHQWWTLSVTLGAIVYVVRQWAGHAVAALGWSPSLAAAPLAMAAILLVAGPAVAARWSDGWSRRLHPSCCASGETPVPETITEPAILAGIRTDPVIRASLAQIAGAMNGYRRHHPGTSVVTVDDHDGIDSIPTSLLLLSVFAENRSPGPLRWNLPVLSSTVYPNHRRDVARFVTAEAPLILDYQIANQPSEVAPGYYLLSAAPNLDGVWMVYAPKHPEALAHHEPEVERPKWPLESAQPPPVLPYVAMVVTPALAAPAAANAADDLAPDTAFKSFPIGLVLPSLQPDRPLFEQDEIALVSAGVQRTGHRFAFPGPADGPFSYVLQTTERPLPKGATFVAAGELTEGGLTVGLQEAGAWTGFANIEQAGRFIVAVQVPHAGRYALVFANNVRPPAFRARLDRYGFFAGLRGWLTGSLPSSFRIDDAGWIDPPPS